MDKLFAPFTEFAEGVQGAQSAAEVWALITALGVIAVVIAAILGVVSLFYIIVEWCIFKKANCPGVACIIPLWNTWCLFKILYGHGWLFLIPGVNIALAIAAPFRLAYVFDRGFGFMLGLIFLPWLFLPILAFGQSDYNGPNF